MNCGKVNNTVIEDIIINPTRYIDIDSSYRNRTVYPYPAEFEVTSTPTNTCRQMNSLSSQDPIVYGYPSVTFDGNIITTAGAFTGGIPSRPCSNTASAVDGFYTGATLVDTSIGEDALILSYDGDNKCFDIDGSFSGIWAATDNYTITDPSTASKIFYTSGPSFDNVYIGFYLIDATIGEQRLIVDYDASTKSIILDTPFSGAWSVTDQYEIIQDPTSTNSGIAAAMTTTTITLSNAPNNLPVDYYRGQYVNITDPTSPIYNEISPIIAYDPVTKIATVTKPFSAAAAPVSYKVLPLSRDNSSYFNIQPTARLESGYYEIELITLILPNITLNVSTGGRIAFYPYVYVEFGNTPQANTRNIITSNNPNSRRALFKCPIYDVVNPLLSSFVKLSSAGMVQTIRFNPYEPYVFKVYLPNGDLYTTMADNSSPILPNPILQISATFAIKRIITNNNINNTPMMMR